MPALTRRPMPKDPFIREKFTRERVIALKLAAQHFERFPKERYQTQVESWRHLQSQNIEFTMKPAAGAGRIRIAVMRRYVTWNEGQNDGLSKRADAPRHILAKPQRPQLVPRAGAVSLSPALRL